jgi:hypothetical protein
MQAAIGQIPNKSTLSLEAITQLPEEVASKVHCGQAGIVDWETTKHDPCKESENLPSA